MALFDIPKRPGRQNDALVAKKTKVTKAPATRSGTLLDRISAINKAVDTNLGQYKDEYTVITDAQELTNYIDTCVKNQEVAMDTETTGLDPLSDVLVGLCLYTPGCAGAYVPLNHTSYVTGQKVDNQLDVDIVSKQLQRLVDENVKVIMFNAKFDIRFIRNQLNVYLDCYWDCYLASRLMNENEEHKGLKPLHKKYVLDGQGDAFSFDELFKGVTFDKVPINTGYLYAAHDAVITYELYNYQKQYVWYDDSKEFTDRNGMNGVSWVFFNIEMPCVKVVCDMEDIGVMLDSKYAQTLSEKYNNLLKQAEERFYRICDDFGQDLDRYREEQGVNNKLEYPINISSSSQIAIMLYDVLRITPPDKKNPRGTGVDILSKMEHPVAKAVLEYREIKKLLSTYIDKLPQCANPKDGRVHCHFNQYGADTGRFSSSDPNLQNIPSRNHDIRKMFVATTIPETTIYTENDIFKIDKWQEVYTVQGWKTCSKLQPGDILDSCVVQSVNFEGNHCVIKVK